MTITQTVLNANENITATGAFVTGSFSAAAGAWILVAVSTVGGNDPSHTVTGSGLDFAPVSEGSWDLAGNDRVLSWHKCKIPVGGFTGTLTITPSGAIGQGHWCVIELGGDVDPDDPIVQAPAIGTGTGTTFTVALAAPRAETSKTFAVAAHGVFQGLAAGTGMVELTGSDQPGNSPAGSFHCTWSDTDFEANPSSVAATSGNWGILAIEVGEAVVEVENPGTVVRASLLKSVYVDSEVLKVHQVSSELLDFVKVESEVLT